MPTSPAPSSSRWLFSPRQALLAMLGGLALAASFPNLDLWPLALVGLVPLFWLAQTLTPRQAFLAGWLYGLTLNLCLHYWLTVAMAIYGGLSWSLSILSLVLLELYLSIFVALFTALVSHLNYQGMNPLWYTPLLWAGLEWIRGWLFTGFPWLPLSAALTSCPPLLQSAELWGATGLSGLVALINGIAARIWTPLAVLTTRTSSNQVAKVSGQGWQRLAIGLMAIILLGTGWWWGTWRMQKVQQAAELAPQLMISVVQANIPLIELWRPGNRSGIVQRHVALTIQAAGQVSERPWLVVWPESAAPFYFFLNDTRDSLPVLKVAHDLGAYITLGSQGLIKIGPPLTASNRVWLVDPQGYPQGYYDKVHLVPFGEYVPAPRIFFFVKAIADLGVDFQPGSRGDILEAGEIALGPLICYESIFPELVRAQRQKGAVLIVNQANDSWFGRTGAARQHMSHLVLRAIENRVAAARAANTGVSCFVLPDGHVVQDTKLFMPAVESRRLPLLAIPTLFTRIGDVAGPVGLSVSLIAWLIAKIRHRRQK